jgi:hypothetical protein
MTSVISENILILDMYDSTVFVEERLIEKYISYLRYHATVSFEAIMAVMFQVQVFWVVMLCNFVVGYQ